MILDTNAVSAAADGDPGIFDELTRADRIAVPVIVIGEYRFGIAGSRRRAEYEQWLQELLRAAMVLEIREATAAQYAQVRWELKYAGTPIPSNDLWIAALSRQHGLPLLSRDQHFDAVRGLRRVAW